MAEKAETVHVSHLSHDNEKQLETVRTHGTDTDKGSIASHGTEGAAFSKERAKAERRLLLKLGEYLHPEATGG